MALKPPDLPRTVRLHRPRDFKAKDEKPQLWTPGDVIVGTDGKQYQVQADGSWRKLLSLATKEEIEKLKILGGRS